MISAQREDTTSRWHLYRREAFRGPVWMQAIERVAAPLKLGGAELMPALLKLGSVFTVASGAGLDLREQSSLHAHPSYLPRLTTHGHAGVATIPGVSRLWRWSFAEAICLSGSGICGSYMQSVIHGKAYCAPCFGAVRNAVLGNLGGQLLRQHVRYEATVQLVVRGAGTLRGRATLNVRPRASAACTWTPH